MEEQKNGHAIVSDNMRGTVQADGGSAAVSGRTVLITLLASVLSLSIPVAAAVSLLHIDTNKRLYTRRQDAFDNRNCAGCPIIGQLEISAHNTGLHDANAHWQAAEGVFFPTRQQDDI